MTLGILEQQWREACKNHRFDNFGQYQLGAYNILAQQGLLKISLGASGNSGWITLYPYVTGTGKPCSIKMSFEKYVELLKEFENTCLYTFCEKHYETILTRQSINLT